MEKNRNNTRRKYVSEECDIVIGTLFAVAPYSHSLDKETTFSFVLIDEAAQAMEPEVLSAELRLKKEGTLVLVGDHMQLPPQVPSTAKALECSQFQRFFDLVGVTKVTLDIQYRMHPDIREFPSSEFYNGMLLDGNVSKKEAPIGGFPFPRSGVRSAFVHVASEERRSSTGLSYFNPGEVDCVKEAVLRFKVAWGRQTIAVITPYIAQRDALSASLKGIVADADINCIDAFQGDERDIVILSLVRNNSARACGFVTERRRFNVAITRAKCASVLVGCFHHFLEGDVGGCVWAFIKNRVRIGCVFNANLNLKDPENLWDTKFSTRSTPCVKVISRRETETCGVWIPTSQTEKATDIDNAASLLKCLDLFLHSGPCMAYFAYASTLPRNEGTQMTAPDDVLDLDFKHWSQKNWFHSLGIYGDPGNVVLGISLYAICCRSGAIDQSTIRTLCSKCRKVNAVE